MDDGDSRLSWDGWLAACGVTFVEAPSVLFQNYPMVIQQALVGRGVALGWRGLIDDLVDGDPLDRWARGGDGQRVLSTWPVDRRRGRCPDRPACRSCPLTPYGQADGGTAGPPCRSRRYRSTRPPDGLGRSSRANTTISAPVSVYCKALLP